jgi:hypothetical protein
MNRSCGRCGDFLPADDACRACASKEAPFVSGFDRAALFLKGAAIVVPLGIALQPRFQKFVPMTAPLFSPCFPTACVCGSYRPPFEGCFERFDHNNLAFFSQFTALLLFVFALLAVRVWLPLLVQRKQRLARP